jgi:hypothetical protein
MLAQMGQMMQMRQMQQQYEQQNNLRDAFAQGTDINDPSTFDRIARQDPKLAMELRSKNFDQQQKQTEVGLKRADFLGAAYSGLVKNPTVDNAYSIFDNAVQMGIIPSQAAAAMRAKIDATGGDPKLIAALAQQGIDAATSAQAKLQAQVTREGHGVTMYGHNVTKQNNEYNQQNPAQHFFTAPDGTLMVAPQRGSGAARPVPMAGSSAPPPQVTIGGGGAPAGAGSRIMVNPSPINNLAPVNQNALITQPQPTLAPVAPVNAQVRAVPVTKDVLDPTDPARKRMITVEVNSYVAGTGLGADGNAPPPKGVLGVAGSPIPPNYMPDPNNPQGVIPVPGSPADPNAVVASGYRRTPDGTGQEFIPGGPADPKVLASQNRVKLSEKDVAAREATYPRATSALKGFEAKTKQFDSVINELIENKKGLDEITGFFAGRTDVSAMSDAGRRALSLFNTITAKGGFSELQAMRNASPTGGALGNVSNQEGKQLIDSFGALSRTQSGDDLRKSLATAKSDLQNLKERMREAYDLTYEYRGAGAGAPALPPGFKAD